MWSDMAATQFMANNAVPETSETALTVVLII